MRSEFPKIYQLEDELITFVYENNELIEIKPPNNLVSAKTEQDNITYPDEIDEGSCEGAKKKVYVNKYERNLKERQKCIEAYGSKYSCEICGFNFIDMYGEIGKEFIHVHHIVSLSELQKNYKVRGAKDLIPVCPNCHAMLHRKTQDERCFTLEELKKIIQK